MGDRCCRFWDSDHRVWIHLPVCSGAAYNGPDQCTCDYAPSPRAAEHLARTRRENGQLRQRLETLQAERVRLWNENLRMRGKTGAIVKSPQIEGIE